MFTSALGLQSPWRVEQVRFEPASRLPKTQQRLVSQIIDTVLQQHGS